jgi:formate/nitrite transporter
MTEPPGPTRHPYDAYSPPQIAQLVKQAGVAKARLPLVQTLALGVLAGAFIAFGAMFYTLAVSGSTLGFGPTRLLGGIAFSLGLILVVVAGAELFTGNNLIVMAWADGLIGGREVLRNWVLVYGANLAGAVASAVIVHLSGMMALDGGRVGETAIDIAIAKIELAPGAAFFRGLLCNALVCLGIWLCVAARGVADKILAIVFPIAAFVGLGFEHSVANMYLIPLAWLAGAEGVSVAGFAANLAVVTAGNIVGGAGFVALTYWICYPRPPG